MEARVDVMLETLRAFLLQIAAFLPRLGLALLVILAGWLVAKTLRFAVVKALRAINFHVLTQRAGVDGFLEQGGIRTDTVAILGMLVYLVVILVALVVAFNGLGLTYVTDLLTRILMFLPRVMVAVVVVAFGIYFARFVGEATAAYFRGAEMQDAQLIGRLAQYAIAVFVVLIALDVLNIGGDIVRQTFLILLAGVVLALALAFGLGGQAWAAALLERWWPSGARGRRWPDKEKDDGFP
jgi:hypothetical protein